MTRSLWMCLFLGCVPASVDSEEDDYMTLRSGPDRLIGSDGNYNGGWYSDFDGEINPDDSTGSSSAFKGWLHMNLANEDYAITAHLADLNTAGNAAIALVDLETGESWSESTREAFADNLMQISDDFSSIENGNDGSFLRVVDGGETLEFDIQAHGMHFEGVLQSTGSDRFIQVTRYHDGYGILQWFEQVEVVEATLTLSDGSCIELPPGMRGTTDRMAGHRRTFQNWNWIAGAGSATRQSDGVSVPIALSMSKDGPEARPQVQAQKYALWVDGNLTKIPSLSFDYTILDSETRETSEWTIASDHGDEDRVDLSFEPTAHRRDQAGYLWFYYTDYNAYLGQLTGSVTLDGEVYTLDPMSCIVEDSILTL
jgi:hypothetical protein